MKIIYHVVLSVVVIGLFFLAGAAYVNLERKPSGLNPKIVIAKKSGAIPLINNENILVRRVIDGDTIELENGEHVRYIGIDAPETVDPRKPVQCFGIEASRRNRELVEGKEVVLEKDISDRDRYGRLLRYVRLRDKLINLVLVQEGYARVFAYPPDVKYGGEFIQAEKTARERNLGLWNSCGS